MCRINYYNVANRIFIIPVLYHYIRPRKLYLFLGEYWDARFREEENYEWFRGFSSFAPLVHRHLHTKDKVLILGNGNSDLPFDLLNAGFSSIVATDLSTVVIQRMQLKPGASAIEWRVEDMMSLSSFKDGEFDAVIEKGVFDVLLVDANPWAPSEAIRNRIYSALGEAHRVLKPQGVLISMTFAGPHFRRPLLLARAQSSSELMIDPRS